MHEETGVETASERHRVVDYVNYVDKQEDVHIFTIYTSVVVTSEEADMAYNKAPEEHSEMMWVDCVWFSISSEYLEL